MSLVKDRQTHFITKQLDGTGQFDYELNLNDADELKVVQTLYTNGGGEADAVFRVSWEGVMECLSLFDVDHSSSVNIRHNVHGKVIRGKYKFRIFNTANEQDNTLNGHLGIVFETVKY